MTTKIFKFSRYQISIVIFYIFVCTYFFFFTSTPFSYYSFHKNDFYYFLPIVICACISFLIANRLLHFGDIGFKKTKLYKIPLVFFYAGILIAVPEEIIFRGFIQTAIQSAIPNITILVIISSAIFGAAHLSNKTFGESSGKWNWKLAAMTFIAGLYLGFAYLLTNSLVLPTILHAIFLVCSMMFFENDSIF